jgi:phosphate-selective porin OprO and OprP
MAISARARSRRIASATVLACGAVVAVLLDGVPAAAQQPEAADPTTVAPPDTTLASPQAEEPDRWRFAWDEHPSLFFGKDTRIDFRVRLQTQIRDSDAAIGDTSDIDLTRRRVGVQGSLKGRLDFQIEQEIGDDDPWRDVFVNYRQFGGAEVQAGKFKIPFSLDENTSSTNLDFVYRSMAATQLAPGRDTGVMVHGRVVNKMLRYETGWFTHDGRNARNRDPEQVYGDGTLAGRLTAQPFRRHHALLKDFQVGIAFTDSHVAEGFPGLHGHTSLDAPFFTSKVWVNGQRRRTGLEARWRPGPASVKAEYIRVSTERRGESVEDTDLAPLVSSGWYVSGTWAVTGEKKADDLTVPRRPLFQGGWGAIELAGRLEAIGFGAVDGGDEASTSPRADVVLGNADHAATFGVNWYPVRHVKVQLNFIHERLADPSRGPSPASPGFWSRVLTFQLDL